MEYTPVHNRFWSDGWIRQLNALDRYLFLYLLTNGRAHPTGIYELPLDLMAAESGIDEKDLRNSMLSRLEPKIYYREDWVIIKNYPNHRVSDSPKLIAGLRKSFEELPKKIQEIAIAYGYPIDTLSIHISVSRNRIEENRIDNTAAKAAKIELVKDEPESSRVSQPVKEGYDRMIKWAEVTRGFAFIGKTKQYKALKMAKGSGLTSSQLKERWLEMAEDDFWQKTGFDWMNVVTSFNKKPHGSR